MKVEKSLQDFGEGFKCRFCKGLIVLEPPNPPWPPRWRCQNCGSVFRPRDMKAPFQLPGKEAKRVEYPKEVKMDPEERLCKDCGKPTGKKSDLCTKCYLKRWHKENDPKIDSGPKRKYTRHVDHEEKNETIKVEGTKGVETKCIQCGQPRRGRSKFCSKSCGDKYRRARAKPKTKKLLPALRRQETTPTKATEMFRALRKAIILDFLDEIRSQLT
jgi:hypothetical protein